MTNIIDPPKANHKYSIFNLQFRLCRVGILEALKRLGMKEPVTAVAIELGYDSPSAFISMFRKALGKTPGQYFSELVSVAIYQLSIIADILEAVEL